MEIRAGFLTASIAPVILGTAVAWGLTGVFLLDVFILTLIAGVCLHIGANVSNDYFDHTTEGTGSDDINKEFIRPFSGGSRVIQEGLLSPKEVLLGSFVFFAIGGFIGVYLAFTRGWLILVIGVLGAGSGFFYTAPPFRLVKRGIGEIFIGLNFGVLMVLGSYYVQAQDIAIEPIMVSLPLSLLIAGVLYINEFPDFVADRDAGKKTAVVRLGRKRAAKGYVVLMVATYLLILVPVILPYLNPGCIFGISVYSLIGLATLPLGVFACRVALKTYEEPMKLVPANLSTILIHLLTGLILSLAYVLHGFVVPLEYTAIIGIVLFVIMLGVQRKLATPPAPPS